MGDLQAPEYGSSDVVLASFARILSVVFSGAFRGGRDWKKRRS